MKHLNALFALLLLLIIHTGASAQFVSTYGTSGPAVCDGFAYINNSGSLISWTWTDDLGNPISSGVSANGDSLYNLCQGNYVLTYVDSTGSGSESFTIGQGPCFGFTVDMITTPASVNACDGALYFDVNDMYGGIGTYMVVISTSAGVINTTIFIDAGALNDLCAGETYYITVSDTNGCTASASGTIGSPCMGLTSTITQTNATAVGSCDGMATVSVSGGTAPYTYLWSNNVTTSTISNLCAGNYSVMITDANGCFDSDSTFITDPCSGLYVSGTVTSITDSVNCNGSISVQASGGTSPYAYNWSNGVSGSSISNLCADFYTVTVTDANGCTATQTFPVSDSIQGGPCSSLGLTVTTTNTSGPVLCDGTATAYPFGGTAPYLVSFEGGAYTSITTITGLCSAVYTASVLDANGCISSGTFYVGNDSLPNGGSNLVGYVYTIDESVAGACDGWAEAYVFGGTPPYQYYYPTGSTSAVEDNLCAGNYSMLVIDANNDTLFLDFLIADPGTVIINTPFPDSTVVDSLFNNLVSNCTIDYGALDSASIYNSGLLSADSIIITWAIYDSSGVQYITETYYIGGGSGVYTFVFSVYCPQKSETQYLKVFDQLYVDPNALGIWEPVAPEALVYPNPFTGNVQVQFGIAGDYTLKLCDITGRQLLEKQVTDSDFTELNNLETLAGGEYLLFIASQGQTTVRKLIK